MPIPLAWFLFFCPKLGRSAESHFDSAVVFLASASDNASPLKAADSLEGASLRYGSAASALLAGRGNLYALKPA